jgi:hypothetical protein
VSLPCPEVVETMERETGFELAPSDLGRRLSIDNKTNAAILSALFWR